MNTFLRRINGAMALNAQVYEEVEADGAANLQAMGVVLLAAAAAAVGVRGLGASATALPTFLVLAILAWPAWAMLTFQIGARLLPTRETNSNVGELLRTLGFAAAPGIFRAVPALARPVFALTTVWCLLNIGSGVA